MGLSTWAGVSALAEACRAQAFKLVTDLLSVLTWGGQGLIVRVETTEARQFMALKKTAEFEWQTEQGELYVVGRSSEGRGLAVCGFTVQGTQRSGTP